MKVSWLFFQFYNGYNYCFCKLINFKGKSSSNTNIDKNNISRQKIIVEYQKTRQKVDKIINRI